MKKIKFFRKKYPVFIYRDYSYKISGVKPRGGNAALCGKNNLEIFFDFRIPPEIFFQHKIVVEKINTKRLGAIGESVLENLIFNLGLVEMLSYWKATCSSEIEIKAGYLDKEQIKWWKDLIIRGMSQYFYENRIDWRSPNFLTITNPGRSDLPQAFQVFFGGMKNRYLVPLGGGKDSIVTLEKLKDQKKKISIFLVNPGKNARNVAKVSGVKETIVVRRQIDPKLLELNKMGYLNGHIPFTAILSFLAVYCGVLFDYKHSAFSNEKSANEGNLKYLGKVINHQYSKSSDFEKRFKNYCQKYLAKNIHYFSFLRQYTELEISKMFVKYLQYFKVFSSCNGSINSLQRWCGKCPKCLFVYLTLCPYLERKKLQEIFGKDLLKDKKLRPLLKSLIDPRLAKPFECVGTKKEARKAYKLCSLLTKSNI